MRQVDIKVVDVLPLASWYVFEVLDDVVSLGLSQLLGNCLWRNVVRSCGQEKETRNEREGRR